MSANTLNPTTYNNVAANTVNDAVLNAAAILAWRQDLNAVVNQHATEIDKKWDNANSPFILTGNGYQKLASGLIIQWGTINATGGGVTNQIVFPVSYPNACFSVSAVVVDPGGTTCAVDNIVQGGFQVFQHSGGGKFIYWISIGF